MFVAANGNKFVFLDKGKGFKIMNKRDVLEDFCPFK